MTLAAVAGIIGAAIVGAIVEDAVNRPAEAPAPPPDEAPQEKGDTTTVNNDFNFNTTHNTTTNNTTINIQPPSLSPGTKVVYVPTGDRKRPGVKIDIKDPPEVPNRRLPKEADGQSDTPTPKKKSISVKRAAAERDDYGGLLQAPIGAKKLKIRQAKPRDLQKELSEQQQKSLKNFSLWVANQSGELTEDEQKELDKLGGAVPYWDCTALVTPQFLSGFEGEIGLMVGLESLHTLASEFRNQRVNAFVEVTGIIPKEYEVKQFTPKGNRTYKETNTTIENGKGAINNSGLGAIAQAVGVNEFPVTVPKSLINHTSEEIQKITEEQITQLKAEKSNADNEKIKKIIDKAIEELEADKEGKNPYTTLTNLPQQTSWIAKILGELLGSYPISIKIQDSDLIKVGEQEKLVNLPNISEVLAELTGLALVNQSQIDLIANLCTRALLETGVNKQMVIKNYHLLDTLRDYTGIKTKEIPLDVEYSYNPFASDNEKEFEGEGSEGIKQEEDKEWEKKSFTERLLTPKLVKIAVEQIDQKEALSVDLFRLNEIHKIIKASLTRSVKDEKAWQKHLLDLASILGSSPSKSNDGEQDDFDKYLAKTEEGFSMTEGITDPLKPYGRDRKQRPKIRRLTPRNKRTD